MKYITKGSEPREFTDWKAKADENWRPSYRDLRGEEKKAVKDALMREQGFICCYCERGLTDADSHIEHLKPQSDPGVDPLDFSNMVCSCQNNLRPGEPRHCGNLKGDWYHPNLLVSPLDRQCEKRFAFYGNGEIRAASVDDLGASETIARMGLATSRLNALRRSAIDPFLDEQLLPADLSRFIDGYLQLDSSGVFGEFYTTIKYLFT